MTFDQWNELSFESKREIWNHHWNPYEPEIGMNTKQAIVEQFAEELKIDFKQIGIGSFGWTVYMLFVIVADSKTRVPTRFSDLSVNKGIIKEMLENGKARVKYGYGGTFDVDLTEKMNVR